MERFVVCGEALIDLVLVSREDSRASLWRALSAGGPMNTAIALARLDHQVAMLARLGSDAFAEQLHGHLAANGVSLDLAVEADEPTSVAVVALDHAGHPAYTFHFDGTANFGWQPAELPELAAGDWLHIASLAAVVPPGAAALQAWVDGQLPGLAGVSYDVNVRPSVLADPEEYVRRTRPWIDLVGRAGGVLKASDEDLEFLGRADGLTWREVVQEWVTRHPRAVVVVTRGPDGAEAYAGGSHAAVPGRRVSVVDTVGAGDTFMAGFLDAWVTSPGDLQGALERGIAAAAIVVQRQGANPPNRADLAAAPEGR